MISILTLFVFLNFLHVWMVHMERTSNQNRKTDTHTKYRYFLSEDDNVSMENISVVIIQGLFDKRCNNSNRNTSG